MKHLITSMTLAAISLALLTSCKKDKDQNPDLTVLRTDTVNLGTTKTTDTIDVLANDTYFDLKQFYINQYGALKLNADSTVAIQTSAAFYGTQIVNYFVTDKNGFKTGTVVIKRGNAEQIKAVDVLKSIPNEGFLDLYAIDDDTNGVYQGGYSNHYIYKTNASTYIRFPELSPTIPAVSVDGYKSILGDGTVYGIDNEKYALFYTIQDGFTAQAKTLDGKRTVTVTGYTITYHGHTLDFIYYLPAK